MVGPVRALKLPAAGSNVPIFPENLLRGNSTALRADRSAQSCGRLRGDGKGGSSRT